MNRQWSISRTIGLAAGLVATTFSSAQAWAATAATPGALRSASTLHSIGLEWDLSGDDDHDARATVEYRAVGEAAWKPAMPLVRVDNATQNGLAGSILFLSPSKSYEVRLTLSDPDGGAATQTLTVTTKSPPQYPQGGRTLHVVPGVGGGSGTAGDPYQGIQAAWTAAQPGDVLLLHAGNYGEVRDTNGKSGLPGKPIVFKAYGDGPAVFNFFEIFRHSYLWFEGLTFQFNGSSSTALYSVLPNPGYDTGFQPMSADIRGLVILRNSFTGYKHSIRAGPRTDGWSITDNTIRGDKQLGGSDTASFDGEGIELAHGSNHIVAYNSITRTADGISFPSKNCDIYGNDIFDVTDDGIELDYGGPNTRAWGNRIHNAGHNGISFQPQEGAPWYIVRNQVVNMQESVFKFREGDRFVVAHNTFVNWGWVLDHWSAQLLGGITRNNLWISVNNGPIWKRGDDVADWRTDLDYDGFDWGSSAYAFDYYGSQLTSLAALTAATGQETHGVRIDYRTCFDSFNVPGPPPFTTIPPHSMTLRSTCPAVNAGVVLPNLSDGYTGSAPDMGAHELGVPLLKYGPRPAGISPPKNLRVQ
jgi:hypothetical protein